LARMWMEEGVYHRHWNSRAVGTGQQI
jgi:hypothetical protein